MALKLPCFVKKSPSVWGLCPKAPSVIHLICIGLLSMGLKLSNIYVQKKLTFGSSFLPISKIMVAYLVALWLQKRSKCDRNSVKIAIFCRKITKITQGRGSSAPQATFVVRLTCSGLFCTGPKLDNFCAKKTFGSIPLLVAKFWSRFSSHSLLQTDFQAIKRNEPITLPGLFQT